MPTYDYACKSCEHEFEFEQSINEDVGTVCPRCRAWTDKRLISKGTSFTLKGSGWAADNYAKKT